MPDQSDTTHSVRTQRDVLHALRKPYLLFIGDVDQPQNAKTAYGIRDWSPEDALAQWRLPGCGADLDLPDMEAQAAAAAGAGSLLIGVAPPGGRIPAHWIPALVSAAEAGLDVVAGLHTKLKHIPELVDAAKRSGTALIDVREPPPDIPLATGAKRSGKRLLTVGSDCALGKKYTALALTKAMRERGLDAQFRATGQTGILIAGQGVPLDSVVVDFAAGAAESLSPDAAVNHWDVIEGQGSLFHPSYAGVTLALVHGSQPDALVLCHDPVRTHISGIPQVAIPPLDVIAQRYLEAARLTNPQVRLVGVSLNTSALDEAHSQRALEAAEALLGVPAFDPLRTSLNPTVDALLAS